MAKQIGILQSLRRAFAQVTPHPRSTSSLGWSDQRLLILVLGVFILAVAGWSWFRKRSPQGDPLRRHAPQAAQALELYQKLERTLVHVGVPRPLATPPLTHATALAEAGHPIGAEAEALTKIYLNGRFGDDELEPDQVSDFERRIEAIRKLSYAPVAQAAAGTDPVAS